MPDHFERGNFQIGSLAKEVAGRDASIERGFRGGFFLSKRARCVCFPRDDSRRIFFFGLVRLFVFRSMIKSRSITMGTKLVRNDSIESASKGWIIRRVCVNGI